jgi:hypothetical protein
VNVAREIVQCVSDGANVTDVNAEDWPACGTLAELGANRYLSDRSVSGWWAHLHRSTPAASTSLLLTGLGLQRRPEGVTVEVKIGITDSPRELVFASTQTPEEVEEAVDAAVRAGSGLLGLTDEKGRRFLIHAAKIAYVEIGAADARRVGFGIGAESKGRHAGKAATSG